MLIFHPRDFILLQLLTGCDCSTACFDNSGTLPVTRTVIIDECLVQAECVLK
jgi:hypothetical protein